MHVRVVQILGESDVDQFDLSRVEGGASKTHCRLLIRLVVGHNIGLPLLVASFALQAYRRTVVISLMSGEQDLRSQNTYSSTEAGCRLNEEINP